MLALKDVTVGYPGKELIVDATAELRSGELVALLGANGAGKSTLLKVMSGRLAPLGGTVSVGTRLLTDVGPAKLATLVALVTTESVGAGALTAREVVSMGRYPYTGFFGRLSAVDHQIVSNALADVGMESFADKDMATLSDGERQKVMIARALAQDTAVILLDEPTAFLDAASRIETLVLLKNLARERHKAVLLSTHDIAPAVRLADRLWLVHDHRLVNGTPAGLATAPDGLGAMFADRQVRFNPSIGDFE